MGIDCGGRMTELTGKHPFQMQNLHLNESRFLSRLTELIPAKKIDVAGTFDTVKRKFCR